MIWPVVEIVLVFVALCTVITLCCLNVVFLVIILKFCPTCSYPGGGGGYFDIFYTYVGLDCFGGVGVTILSLNIF